MSCVAHILRGISVLALCACTKTPDEAVVKINSTGYKMDRVQSDLATPIVDEIVRVRSSRVIMNACVNISPGKVIQLQRELAARSTAELVLVRSEAACLPD
jgi:hypothetical protein